MAASFLADTSNPLLPRHGAVIFLADGTGAAATGGVTPNAFADLSDYLAKGDTTPAVSPTSHDNLIAAGIRRMRMLWWDGQVALGAATDNNCVGSYPRDYPSGTAGLAASCTPITQVQHQAIVNAAIGGGGRQYLDQWVTAMDTAGRKGSLYDIGFYDGCPPANSAVDNTTLDSYSEIVRALGGVPALDILGVVACANRCCPALMGANCLGYWEADKLVYTDAGTTLATADNSNIYRWTSPHPTASARYWQQTNGFFKPTWQTNELNGLPVVRFDGGNDRMTLSSAMPAGAAFTLAMVVKPGNADSMILSHTTLNRQVRFNEGTAGRIGAWDGTSASWSAGSVITAGTWYILRLRYDGTNCRIYVNGTEVATYSAGPAFTSNMALDLLGCFGNGGASNFFNGDLYALALLDASCTDNQIQLIEADWSHVTGISVAGSPVLPVKAYVERLFSTYGIRTVREPWDRRDVTDLQGWNTNSGGIVTNPDRMALAMLEASLPVFYTKASISSPARAEVYILNNGPSVSARRATHLATLAAGVDSYLDYGGFTEAERDSTIAAADAAILALTPVVSSMTWINGGRLKVVYSTPATHVTPPTYSIPGRGISGATLVCTAGSGTTTLYYSVTDPTKRVRSTDTVTVSLGDGAITSDLGVALAAVSNSATTNSVRAVSKQPQYCLWNYPPSGSALLARARNRTRNDTHVMAIVQVDAVNNNKPPGYPDYGSNSIANWAKRVVDHLEYQGFVSVADTDNYGGTVCPLNWGVAPYHTPLRNPLDAVGGDGCSEYGLYIANTLATGPGTLHQDMTDRVAAVKAECDLRGIKYPKCWCMDNETRPTVQFAFRNDDVTPVDLDGSWPETVASGRYISEVLVTLPTNMTLSDLVAGQPAQSRTADKWFFFGLDNQAWSKLVYAPIEDRVHDRVLYELVGKVVEATFPGATYCNYALQAINNSALPVRDANNRWLYWYQSPTTPMLMSMQNPRCYGPAITSQSYDPSNNAEHGLGTSAPEIWRNYTYGQVMAGVASGVPSMPCVEVAGTVSGDVAGQHTPTTADAAWLIERCSAVGVSDWLIFNPSPPMSAGEASAITATQARATSSASLVDIGSGMTGGIGRGAGLR